MNRLIKLAKNPQMIVSWFWNYLALKTRETRVWKDRGGRIAQKQYRSYDDYLTHQKSKLRTVQNTWLVQYDDKYQKVLSLRLQRLKLEPGQSVLCLAARMGTEVKAFRDLREFAVGVDINPGKDNQFVLYGDFHKLSFANSSVDIIFTNSLDHVHDIKAFLKEIFRVLKTDGKLILELGFGASEGGKPGYYESFYWQKIDDMVTLFKGAGFRLQSTIMFDYPWPGKQLLFSRSK